MNTRLVYGIVGAALLTVVAIFILLPEDGETPQNVSASGEMPEGHPDVGDNGMPGVGNVRGDFMEEYNRLKSKMAQQDKADTSEVLTWARMLLSAHKAKESIPYFERYLDAAPNNITLMLDLSVAYFEAAQMEKAEALTNRILAMEPGNTTAMYNLGALYAAGERKAEAKAAWQKLIDRYPESSDAARAKQFIGEL